MYIPLEIISSSLTVKRSIFTGYLIPVTSKEDIDQALASIRSQNLSARHVCYAYRLNDGTYKYSDDGEPSGTAGMPLYKTLTGHDLTNNLIAVSRIFGGVLLGPGGLARAYTDSANAAIEKTLELHKLGQLTEVVDITIHIPYAFTDTLIRMIGKSRIESITYQNDCELKTTLPLLDSQAIIDYIRSNAYQGLSCVVSESYLALYNK